MAVDLARAGWLTLVVMMLLSRVLFQFVGADEMRRFLKHWASSRTKRIWGVVALAYAAAVIGTSAFSDSDLSFSDSLVCGSLVLVLVVDGTVNVLPAGFQTFKDSVQAAWVGRMGERGRGGDEDLFTTINAALAVASLAAGAIVVLYSAIDVWIPITAVAGGVLLTFILLLGASAERSHVGPESANSPE